MRAGEMTSAIAEGEILWEPSASYFDNNNQLTKFVRWLADARGLKFSRYEALWHWSVSDLHGFWGAIWDYFNIISDTPYTTVVEGEGVFGARWFPGSRTNYAEHILRYEAKAAPDETVLCHSAETRPLATMSWSELGAQVRVLATSLRALGIRPGDRVISYMPNVPEAAVAMLATVAIGAVWSAAAPEFGSKTVIDRFGQIAPKLAFVSDGYSFGGKTFDRRDEIEAIVSSLPTLETVVWLPFMGLSKRILPHVRAVQYGELLSCPPVAASEFRFERVPTDHPLWILFSSGTTGLPKAIVHGHVGMIAEHYKITALHFNLSPAKRMFFYSTTGWMMWNTVISSLIAGSSAVLYDGSPTYGGIDKLWRVAAESRATLFGASPTLVQNMKKAGVQPGKLFDLGALDAVLLGGAPSTPETYQWFYQNVKPDLWVTSQSGGTEICSGLAVAVPGRPVYAGEIQGRALGFDLHVWSDEGADLVDDVGELVVLKPAPSMPLRFWGDTDNSRYFDSYFSYFPGVWRHGDRAKINTRGGIYIYGRSDSTLNRFGVRIGSAEIYSVLERVPGVIDSLIVCCETANGGYYMPLFVVLESGVNLTDDMKAAIARKLRDDASPRHVPDEIHRAPAIPYTLTGKKMEVPIRKLMMGVPLEKAASRDATANPEVLDWFAEFAMRPDVVAHRSGHNH